MGKTGTTRNTAGEHQEPVSVGVASSNNPKQLSTSAAVNPLGGQEVPDVKFWSG